MFLIAKHYASVNEISQTYRLKSDGWGAWWIFCWWASAFKGAVSVNATHLNREFQGMAASGSYATDEYVDEE
jgi:hypothetical protein